MAKTSLHVHTRLSVSQAFLFVELPRVTHKSRVLDSKMESSLGSFLLLEHWINSNIGVKFNVLDVGLGYVNESLHNRLYQTLQAKQPYQAVVSVAQWLGRWTSDPAVMSSIPGPRLIRHLGQLSLPSLRGR